MPLTIGSNIASQIAQRRLAQTSDGLSSVFERLSSGQRINKASDDAAGLAIAQSLRVSGRVYSQAVRNLNDGVSALAISEGSLRELSSVLERQLELATQAANGTYSLKQRKALQSESDALTDEFNRIVSSTTFNGQQLLDGSLQNLTLQAGSGSNATLSVGVGNELDRAQGTGGYTQIQTIGAYYGGAYDVLQDVSGDGRADYVVAAGGAIRTFLAQPDGTLASAPSYTLSTGAVVVGGAYVADVNGDGSGDVIAWEQSAASSFGVYLNNGDGSFRYASTFAGSSGVFYMRDGDFNGDGKRDIAVGRPPSGGSSVSIYLGRGDGTFGTAATTMTFGNSYNIAVGDLNNDGRDDVYVGGESDLDFAFLGQANGSFVQSYSGANVPATGNESVVMGDFDRDGFKDVIVSAPGRTAVYLKGRGDGAFDAGIALNGNETIAFADKGEAVDANGDGYLDYVTNSTSVLGIRLGNGNGTFAAQVTYALGSNGGVHLGDLNGDGVYDAVGINFGTAINVYRANTTQTTQIAKLDILSQAGAREAISTTNNSLNRVRAELGSIGSHQSRVEVATANLQTVRENYAAAENRISDVDVASTSAELARLTILQQVGQSVLAQANLVPDIALRLIRG